MHIRNLTFIFVHLADAFIQRDLQKRKKPVCVCECIGLVVLSGKSDLF